MSHLFHLERTSDDRVVGISVDRIDLQGKKERKRRKSTKTSPQDDCIEPVTRVVRD